VRGPDRRRLEHIAAQIEKIERYTSQGRAVFDADERTQDAVLRCLTVIGEAAAALSEETYVRLSSLPPKLPKGQRNIIVHEYWRIDLDLVWGTVAADLPPLRAEIERLLAD
jgi:uncharacterized protein with HEPN domain